MCARQRNEALMQLFICVGDIVSDASVNCGWWKNHHLLEQGFNSSQGQVRDHSEGME